MPFLSAFDYSLVHSTEGALRRLGNDVQPARLERDTQPTAGSWESTTSWYPPDDPQFALDPDDGMYNTVLEGGVMEDFPQSEPPAAAQKKQSIVSVSVVFGVQINE